MFAETLQMLADDDLAGLGHNSADYIHLLAEALKLSFADRDAYYGDPDHVDVPMAGLLDSGYTGRPTRRDRLQPRDPGDARRGRPVALRGPFQACRLRVRAAPAGARFEPSRTRRMPAQ